MNNEHQSSPPTQYATGENYLQLAKPKENQAYFPHMRKGENKMELNYKLNKTRPIAKMGRMKTIYQTIISLLVIFLEVIFTAAQNNTRNPDYSADKSLKSNARVNPSTLAMELSIPVSGYAGRAGHSLPVAFDYSSKVWEVQKIGYPWTTLIGTVITDTNPIFAKRTAAGWSSSLASPRIDYQFDVYEGYFDNEDSEGQIYSPPLSPDPGADSHDLYYVKRLHVQMPDGSTHELRASDTPIYCGYTPNNCTGYDFTGTFYAVDGSKMRLEAGESASTLYLPDGSSYLFGTKTDAEPGHLANTFIDRHGNQMTYNATTKQWTDTMGRVITDPIPLNWIGSQHQTVGDTTVNYPSIGSGTMNVVLSWRYLKDPGSGESGLGDTSQTLAYYTNMFCNGGITNTITAGHLFNGSNPVRLCSPGSSNPGDQFNPVVLTKITLPNGNTYEFKYNLYGEIEKIIYPTGGYERFAYAQFKPLEETHLSYDKVNRGVSDRWISAKGDGTDEVHWTYAATHATGQPYVVAVTAPDGTKTEQVLHDQASTLPKHYGYANARVGRAYEDRVLSASNNLLRRHLTSYTETTTMVGYTSGVAATRDMRPDKEINLIFESGASSALATMTETTYDSNSDVGYFAALNPTITKRYNYISVSLSTAQTADIATIAALFSSGDLADSSETDYLYNSSYKARNIVTLPTDTRVKDASGNVKAKSQIAYDEVSTYPIISAGTDSQWTDPSTNYRGNVTTTKSWTDIGGNLSVETHAQYDNFGNLRKAWDAKGNLSETEYTSTYKYAYPTKVTSPIPDSSGTNGSSTVFETTSTYDLTTGLTLTTTDANGQTTTMEYTDDLLRPTKVTPPSGAGITEIIYTDTPGSMAVKTKTQIDSTNYAESTVYADGLGRTIKSEKKDNAGNVFVETEFDNMGRAKKTTNPYRSGDTKLWTENTYDDLSRITKVKTPDNAEVNTAYDLSTSGTLGTVVTVTDQASKVRRSLTNGLGQLVRVDEPDDSGSLGTISSPNQATSYAYDTLSNLTSVTQGGQTRTFSYDSAARLKQAVNPESGTIAYTYDDNSNLSTKTDARSIVTTYTYDNLNRAKTRSYSDSTPTATYYYDGKGLSSVPSYSKGKLTKVSSSVSETKYTSFDNAGKLLTSQQITDTNTYDFGYSYNLGGMLLEETYPSGRVVKNTIDTDASLSKVETKQSSGSYATRAETFSYTAAGAVSSMKLGNTKWENAVFNSRLQPTQLGLGTSSPDQSLWKVNYDYGSTDNNGNIKSQTIIVPSLTAIVQNYTYDSLNRIKSAEEIVSSSIWKQTFDYDRFGNRRFDTSGSNTTTIPSGCSTAQCNPTIDTANNRFTTGQGYTFDLSGNLLTDAESRTFTYDAENKQQTVSNSGGTIGTYSFDGDGKRVKKVSATETTLFVYDASGKMVAEYLLTEATPTSPTTSYLTNDTLGSPRVITDSSGNVQSRRDFMPFGEEIATIGGRTSTLGYQMDAVRQKFTSNERDNETDLDFAQARMYSSKIGRFSTTDPILMTPKRTVDPQRINLYAYVRNNPLVLIDPSGQDIDDNHLSDNQDYQKWKSAFLATADGQRLWDKYNNNKNYTLKIAWVEGKNGALTDNFKFKDGKLVGATITLGSEIDNPNIASKRDSTQYPLSSALGESNTINLFSRDKDEKRTTVAVGIFAHEFGHVEDANANPAKFQLLQAYHDLRNEIIKDHGNAGLMKGIRGDELTSKKEAFLQAFGVKNDREFDLVTDNAAERVAIPVIQQRYGNLGKEIPPSVQNAITKLQGGNK